MTHWRTSSSVPWRLPDMLVLYVLSGIGFATLFIAWWGISGTARVSRQVAWINVAAAGVLVLGSGNCLWLLIGRRNLGERRRRLFEDLSHTPVAEQADGGSDSSSRPVWAPGMVRYHRPECQLVQGKATKPMATARHERAGRRPCGMCRP